MHHSFLKIFNTKCEHRQHYSFIQIRAHTKLKPFCEGDVCGAYYLQFFTRELTIISISSDTLMCRDFISSLAHDGSSRRYFYYLHADVAIGNKQIVEIYVVKERWRYYCSMSTRLSARFFFYDRKFLFV